MAVGRGPLSGIIHGTIGTMVNPALQIGMLYYILRIFNNKRYIIDDDDDLFTSKVGIFIMTRNRY